MPKLTNKQLVILSAAAQRDDGAVLPLPTSLGINKGAAASVLKSLIKKGLIEERPAGAGSDVWRESDEGVPLALTIADSGLAAIGVEPDQLAEAIQSRTASKRKTARIDAVEPSARPSVRGGTKQALLIELLERKRGATLDEAVEAIGWQRHSVRGAISGTLKKKLGLTVSSERIEGRGRIYRIAAQS